MTGRSQTGLALLLILVPATIHAQGLSPTEKQKIEALINQVGALKNARFIRNGSTYQVATAVRFLRGKWEANAAEVKSAKDFVEKVASFSATSGKPYLIRFADGREIKSQEFLLAELKRIETGG